MAGVTHRGARRAACSPRGDGGPTIARGALGEPEGVVGARVCWGHADRGAQVLTRRCRLTVIEQQAPEAKVRARVRRIESERVVKRLACGVAVADHREGGWRG